LRAESPVSETTFFSRRAKHTVAMNPETWKAGKTPRLSGFSPTQIALSSHELIGNEQEMK
jgi:hypothetical protein